VTKCFEVIVTSCFFRVELEDFWIPVIVGKAMSLIDIRVGVAFASVVRVDKVTFPPWDPFQKKKYMRVGRKRLKIDLKLTAAFNCNYSKNLKNGD
jgi:hypothetical protein